MDEKKCYICDSVIKGTPEDLFLVHTTNSKTLLYKVLEKMLNRNLVKYVTNYICRECINRVNKYEFATMLAVQIETEVLETFKNTENKYGVDKLCEVEAIELERSNIQETLAEESMAIGYEELVVDDWQTEENTEELVKVEDPDLDSSTEWHDQQKNKKAKVICDDGEEFVVETVSIDIKPFKSGKSTSRKRNYCIKCAYQCSSATEFKEHNVNRHPAEVLQCHICGLSCEDTTKLNKHIRSHPQPVQCSICNKILTQKGALKRHMAIHTGEKPYQCDICGKQFIHSSSFHMHNLAHGDIREVSCQICGLKLRSKSHLSRHILIHTGEKRHECPKCGQKFAQRYNMNVHLKSHDGIKRIKSDKHFCETCGEKFKTLPLLNEHRSNKHGDFYILKQEYPEPLEIKSIYNDIIHEYSNDNDNENVKVEFL